MLLSVGEGGTTHRNELTLNESTTNMTPKFTTPVTQSKPPYNIAAGRLPTSFTFP
jgi:hypothetical protein